ncbi:MAG TPA: anti-sigma factor [Candidatus Acidoferrum sp.]|jgi:anti-sigma-K factor RskA|nr:anti-sigma factor [Candidatus Acidoferrum sp.]
MSAHDDMLDNVAAFALGSLDAHDVRVVELHMQTCAECRAEYDAMRPVVTAVGSAAGSDASPSPMLKTRIMKEVRAASVPARRRSVVLPYALAAACLLLVAGLGAVVVEQNQTIVELAGARRVAFAQGDVLVARDRLYLAVHGLPPLPAGRVYQTWTLAKGAKTVTPSVTFAPDAHGSALVAIPTDVDTTVATAISVEPAGGSLQPTTKPIAVVTLHS